LLSRLFNFKKKYRYKCGSISTYKYHYNVTTPTTYTNIYKFKCPQSCYGNYFALETINICIIGACPTGYNDYTSTSTTSVQKYYCAIKFLSDKQYINQNINCAD